MNKKRIFLGVWEIAGYYYNLAQGLKDLGYQVTYLDLGDNIFQYFERGEFFATALKKIHSYYRSSLNLFARFGWGTLALIGRLLFFIWAVLRCDVFILGFGRSFFRNYELPFLKLLGKKVICFVGHGAEARPPYLDGARLLPDGSCDSYDEYARLVADMTGNLRQIEKYADCIIASPPSDHFLHRRYIPMIVLGIPYGRFQEIVNPASNRATIRILHAPSNEVVKGSALIRETIKRLVDRGYPIEYAEISGKPHSVVIQELNKCDFVIDQLYSDTPLAGFACEAAWFGKPAIVGGYLWSTLKEIVQPDLFPVSEICHPDELEKAIEKLILDHEYREGLGRQARGFVERQWTRRIVSEKFAQLIQGDIPDEWWYSPFDHPVNVYGAGLPATKAKELLRLMLRGGGVSALGLTDKPEIERQFVQFANQE